MKDLETLKDLKLNKKTEAKVREWLNDWLQHFIALADNEEGNIYRADFKKLDVFYFTNCNDILSKDPESAGVESNKKIRRRKQCVMMQMFVKTLLDVEMGKKMKCTHCGYPDRYIDGTDNGGGHFVYCPKCKYTSFGTYPEFYDEFLKYMNMKLKEKGVIE